MRGAVERPVSDDNDQNLQKEDQKDDSDEHRAFSHFLKNIQLILNFPRVQKVEQLQKHKQIEHERVVPGRPVHVAKRLVVIRLSQVLISSSRDDQTA